MTQKAMVLEALKAAGSVGLTPLETFQWQPKITRLAAIIHNLRHMEHYDIVTEEGRDGKVARYVLRDARPFALREPCQGCGHTLASHVPLGRSRGSRGWCLMTLAGAGLKEGGFRMARRCKCKLFQRRPA